MHAVPLFLTSSDTDSPVIHPGAVKRAAGSATSTTIPKKHYIQFLLTSFLFYTSFVIIIKSNDPLEFDRTCKA